MEASNSYRDVKQKCMYMHTHTHTHKHTLSHRQNETTTQKTTAL